MSKESIPLSLTKIPTEKFEGKLHEKGIEVAENEQFLDSENHTEVYKDGDEISEINKTDTYEKITEKIMAVLSWLESNLNKSILITDSMIVYFNRLFYIDNIIFNNLSLMQYREDYTNLKESGKISMASKVT